MTDTESLPLHRRAGEIVRIELFRRGLTYVELGKALGLARETVSSRLSGRTPLTLTEIEKTAQYLQIPVRDLLGLDT